MDSQADIGSAERRAANNGTDALVEQVRIDQKRIAELQAQGLVDRELIDRLHAQELIDQDLIAHLHAEGLIDQDMITHLQAEGLVDQDKIGNLREALTSARLIGAAIGIIMHAADLDQRSAFSVLIRLSQAENVKLHLIAARVVEARSIKP